MSYAEMMGHDIPSCDYGRFDGHPTHQDFKPKKKQRYHKKQIKIAFGGLLWTTNKAYLLRYEGKETWIPKSLINLNKSTLVGRIPKWLFDAKFGCECY